MRQFVHGEARVVALADNRPTAAAMRALGYVIDVKYTSADIPAAYMADSPTPPGQVRYVK